MQQFYATTYNVSMVGETDNCTISMSSRSFRVPFAPVAAVDFRQL